MANTWQQDLANSLTKDDGKSYVDGVLTDDKTGKAIDDSKAVVGNDGSVFKSSSDDNSNKVSSTVNKVTSTVKNVASGIKNDVTMGYDKLMLSDEEFVKKYGQDAAADFDSRTKVTQFVNKDTTYTEADLKALYGFTDAEIASYNQKMQMKAAGIDPNDDNGGSSGAGGEETEDGTGEEEATESGPSPLSAESILEYAKSAGLVASNEEIAALVADPKGFLETRGAKLSDLVPTLDPETAGALLNPANPNYLLGNSPTYDVSTVSGAQQTSAPKNSGPETYDVATATDRMDNPQYNVDPVTGEIRTENLVDAEDYTIDMQGAATGINADGTVNETGQALNDYAMQKFSNIIDTSTVAGKLLAQELGEGNYTDSKATILGQMDIISGQFVDANGNPKIPPWAQGISRELSRTIAFKGMSGTAATAAMATALMEASLGVAEKEATFFQTLTAKNLDNRQQSIINKANVLAKFDLANLDARETAAVNNAKAFLEMDLTNLSNEQQAEGINTQARVQALFEDVGAENAQRLFTAESQNDFTKFYDQISVQVQQFNAEQTNLIRKFNAGEINDAAEFNAAMEDSRQKFYSDMQFQIDTANAKWRQTVATSNTQMLFDAAATDVRGILDISQEGLNRTWDRVDAMMDYIFKGSVAEEEFELKLLIAQLQAQAGSSGGGGGNFVKDIAELWITKTILSSDERLKDNITFYKELNGIKFYTWTWNEEAKRIGADQYPAFGVIAQEVQLSRPDAVEEGPYGYLQVNYGKLKNEI